jgi:hypothetical protein
MIVDPALAGAGDLSLERLRAAWHVTSVTAFP